MGRCLSAAPFDPGSAAPSNDNLVAGVFNALSGSSVTTDGATLEIASGGRLNIAPAQRSRSRWRGMLLDDGGGQVLVEGAWLSAALSRGNPAVSSSWTNREALPRRARTIQCSDHLRRLEQSGRSHLRRRARRDPTNATARPWSAASTSIFPEPSPTPSPTEALRRPAQCWALGNGPGPASHLHAKRHRRLQRRQSPQVAVNVDKANQNISFTAPASPIGFVANETVTLVATGGGSGNAVVFSIDPASTGSGTISGNVLMVTGTGGLVIDANEAENANYNAAPQLQQSLVVSKASQVIRFTAQRRRSVSLRTRRSLSSQRAALQAMR